MTITLTKEVTFIPTDDYFIGKIAYKNGTGHDIVEFLKTSLLHYDSLKSEFEAKGVPIFDDEEEDYVNSIVELIVARGMIDDSKLTITLGERTKVSNGENTVDLSVTGEVAVNLAFEDNVLLTLVDPKMSGSTFDNYAKRLFLKRRNAESEEVADKLVAKINRKLRLLNYDKQFVVDIKKLGLPTYVHAIVRDIQNKALFNPLQSLIALNVEEEDGVITISFQADKQRILANATQREWYKGGLIEADIDKLFNNFLDLLSDISESLQRITKDYALAPNAPSKDKLVNRNGYLFISRLPLTPEDISLIIADDTYGTTGTTNYMVADFIKSSEAFQKLAEETSFSSMLASVEDTICSLYQLSGEKFFLKLLRDYGRYHFDFKVLRRFEVFAKALIFDNLADKHIGDAETKHHRLALTINGFTLYISKGNKENSTFPVYSVSEKELSGDFFMMLEQLGVKGISFEVASGQEMKVLARDWEMGEKAPLLATLPSGFYYAFGYDNAVLIIRYEKGGEL